MPIGPLGEILGTTGTLDTLSDEAKNYKSRVIAPRNPKLVREGEDYFKMKPSQFMFTMAMDTKERLQNMHTMKIPKKVELLDMSETTHQKVSKVNIDDPIFQPFPSEVIFQNFKAGESYEIPLLLRNNDKVPRLIKVTCADSPYFKIIGPNNVGDKVGAGLPTTFRIQFFPEQEDVDYKHELICVTEREKFKVQITGIGARAILDFPDEIQFPKTPVKYTSKQTILVRNIGKRVGNFSLDCQLPFNVRPKYGRLAVNDSMQIEIEHKSNTIGDSVGEMLLKYDTGEELFINLKAQSEMAIVRLDKNSIRIENTYITMANQRTVSLSNRSDVIANFRWTAYHSEAEEMGEKSKWAMVLEEDEEKERERWNEEVLTDPSLNDKLACLSRSILNRRRIIENDEMLYLDDVLKVEPVKGEIWPNSSADITITFKPQRAESYIRPLYCDITGREQRLGLKVIGEGIGPKVELSFINLDIGNVFIGSCHSYEIVLANKGDIDAIYTIEESKSKFGKLFKFNPTEGIVMPGGHQAIGIEFMSPILGDFKAPFHFQVDGCKESLQLTVTGSVIGPTFNFNKSCIDFQTVSFGFKQVRHVVLSNTSLVPMTYKLRIPEDGTSDAVEATNKYAILTFENTSTEALREFWIAPFKGTIRPLGEQEIAVTICSNTVMNYDYHLVVDVEQVGEDILHIPVIAESIVPDVALLTPILEYGRCFLRHPYEHNVILRNDSELPAVYDLLPQKSISLGRQNDDEKYFPLTYRSSKPKAVLNANTTIEIPLIVTPQELDELCAVVKFMIFGDPHNLLEVQAKCIGEGPVVHISPLELNWGVIPVLENREKTIRLSNESLITAKFTGRMIMKKSARNFSAWSVQPEKGEVKPHCMVELKLTACLNDCVEFKDSFELCIENGCCPKIPVEAVGVGTTIVVDPPICPSLNMGPNFCVKPVQRQFRLTNAGRRHQTLIWSTEGFTYLKPISKAYRKPVSLEKDVKYKNKPPPPPPPQPIFKLTPTRMDLDPGQFIDVLLEGYVDSAEIVKEKLICHAIIGKKGGKELIMKSNLICEFITPLLKFSTESLEFRIDKNSDDDLVAISKEIVIENLSSLPLNINISTNYPFQIFDDDTLLQSSLDIELGRGENKCLVIHFDPYFEEDLHIRKATNDLIFSYNQHPHVDKIQLSGQVNFPNLAFEKDTVNFGCILNDTEVTRYVNMTNVSPMPINYKWVFLFDDNTILEFAETPVEKGGENFDDNNKEEENDFMNDNKMDQDDNDEYELMNENDEENEFVDEIAEFFDESTTKEEEDSRLILAAAATANNETTMADVKKYSSDKIQPIPEDDELEIVNEPEIKVDNSGNTMKKIDDDNQSKCSEADSIKNVAEIDEKSSSNMIQNTPSPDINPVLTDLLKTTKAAKRQIGLEEIFDILPLYGSLRPGDTEQITLTFFGHADLICKTKALCIVEGGPTYELNLIGEASLISYSFDCLDIDFGKQMYNEVSKTEIILHNTGRVGFDYKALNIDEDLSQRPPPGIPILYPHFGYVEPFSSKVLNVLYLPGIPSKFNEKFEIQIAHLEPNVIEICGEGVFPRISLDLPKLKLDDNRKYEEYLKLAKECLDGSLENKSGGGLLGNLKEKDMDSVSIMADEYHTDLDLQMEIERLVVQDFAIDQFNKQKPISNILILDPVPPSQPQQQQQVGQSFDGSMVVKSSKSFKQNKIEKPNLPEYLLDFGYVILGRIEQKIVRITNTGYLPTTFRIDESKILKNGFKVDNRSVKNLPGSPDHETIDVLVTFDPRAANLELGIVEEKMLINIAHGPNVIVVTRACVTMPNLNLSMEVIDFENVLCGQCKVITVQLHNPEYVPCEWSALTIEKKVENNVNKHVPMHLRKKIRNEIKRAPTFEMIPPCGMIEPGQRTNAQLKFMPSEEKSYEERIVFKIEQSSFKAMLLARGFGMEPRIEFSQGLVKFGPVLPYSVGDEQDVDVINPCNFNIEIYNLEFDKAYLQDEKILRLQQGYDEYETILLPPREPSEKLPPELIEYYDVQMKKLEEIEKARKEAEERAILAEEEKLDSLAVAAADLEKQQMEEQVGGDVITAMPEKIENVGKITKDAITATQEKDKKGGKKMNKRQQQSDMRPMRNSSELKDEIVAEKRDTIDDELKKNVSEKEPTTNVKETKDKNEDNKTTDVPLSRPITSVTAVESITQGKSDEIEETAVTKALSRHLGIDLSKDGRANRNRRGIAIIVHGAPLSGKSGTALELAKRYDAALVSIDGVIIEAILAGNSPHAMKARELCVAAWQDNQKMEMEAAEKAHMSVEALNAHTNTAGQVVSAQMVAQSLVSGQRSTVTEVPKTKATKPGKAGAANTGLDSNSLVPSSPKPLSGPIPRKISVIIPGLEDGLMSTVLPDDVVINILSDRLMLTDCQKGIVFDSLETIFSQNLSTSCMNVLKAINNRKYLYFVNLKHSYTSYKESKQKAEEAKQRLAKELAIEEQRRLEDMSEDEYDALNEEEKASIDMKRLIIKKERLRKEKERLERERKEREEREAEQRRLEEEAKKKKRKGGAGASKDAKDDKGKAKVEVKQPPKDQKSSSFISKHDDKERDKDSKDKDKDRPPSQQTADRVDSGEIDGKKKKTAAAARMSTTQFDKQRPMTNEGKKEGSETPIEKEPELTPEQIKERELDDILQKRFLTYDCYANEIQFKIDNWDRTKGVLRPPTPDAHTLQDEVVNHPPSAGGKKLKQKKDRAKILSDKMAAEKTVNLKEAAEVVVKEGQELQSHDGTDSHVDVADEDKKEKKRLEDGIGIPCCSQEFNQNQPKMSDRVLAWEKWPSRDEILDGLGLGPQGPAIPPAITFSVVPFPVKRQAPNSGEQQNYIFVASSPDDPNVVTERSVDEITEENLDKPATPEPTREATKLKRGRKQADADVVANTPMPDDKKGKKQQRGNSGGKRTARRLSNQNIAPLQSASGTPINAEVESQMVLDSMNAMESKTPKLNNFRWIIPANGKTTLRIRFRTEDRGQFDQTLNFEIVGTRRKYSLYCRGITDYPTICREPRIVFPSRIKSKKVDEIVLKKYVLATETFEFGPLLIGKSRDRYKEGRYSENLERLTISNTSAMLAQVSFCFRHDSKADTYLLDPPIMDLEPGQSEQLTIWAYPKEKGEFSDELICCVKDNPEPIRFKLMAYGERPELEIERKVIQFEKVLLHRRDDKSLFLRNTTRLPVKWRLSGLENLGEDFSVSQQEGIIEPKGEFKLVAYFRALKAVVTSKKPIRLEVLDVDNVIGLVQSENIQIHAEAYDVALDVSFPKGTEGGLDFETQRVNDEFKQICSLKNKGKYDIEYEFVLQPTPKCPLEYCKYFTIIPAKGRLTSSDRPAQVQVSFKAPKEITVNDESILLCKIIEPNVAKGGEPIAHIPIKISAKSMFSKFNIAPMNDINFGAMNVNAKKSRTFCIRNDGERYEFKFQITRLSRSEHQHQPVILAPTKAEKRQAGLRKEKSRDGSSSGKSALRQNKRSDSVRDIALLASNAARIQLGPFIVYPSNGTVLPGGQAIITVECTFGEQEGRFEEQLAIDITGRNPKHNPEGIPYTLIAEACVPDISGLSKSLSSHSTSIFEEHLICKSLSQWSNSNCNLEVNGIYGEDERRFQFFNVLVGNRCAARFKFSNLSKVPCDVSFSIKALQSGKSSAKLSEVFDVEPSKAQIPVHGYQYATVTFCPTSMQYFSATFEMVLENALTTGTQGKLKSLNFDLCGEGNLPRINIVKPSVRNKKGQALLLFQRILLSRCQKLPLVLSNDGNLPTKVHLDLMDPDKVFSLEIPSEENSNIVLEYLYDSNGEKQRRPHTASFVVNRNESTNFKIVYKPKESIRSQAQIRLSVVNNQYEDTILQLVGEGFVAPITLDNISTSYAPIEPELQEGAMADDDVAAANDTHLYFGHLQIDQNRSMRFTMTNHSNNTYRFVWPNDNRLTFVPSVGHLHEGCAKDVVVSFKCAESVTLEQEKVVCKLQKINFDKPANEINDWDDRTRTVKWVDCPAVPNTAASSSKNPTSSTPVQTPSVQIFAKKKIVEAEPEPPFNEISDGGGGSSSSGGGVSNLELTVSAICDFSKYECKVESIHFRETLMFQSRIYELVVTNKGVVNMEINWQIFLDELTRGVTPTARVRHDVENMGESNRSSPNSIISEVAYIPFSISPESAIIRAGKKESFTVKFTPLDVNDYEAKLVGNIPNLEGNCLSPVVGLKGRSTMPYVHFELEDSDYVKAARRDPKLRGPNDTPAGTSLDANTRVIEYNVIGVGMLETRKFTFVNPTTKHFSFEWICLDVLEPKIEPNFTCLTNNGCLNSGKKGECSFQFKSTDLGLIESFWKIEFKEIRYKSCQNDDDESLINFSVPFLLVGHVREPNVIFNRSHINFKSILIGHEGEETVALINGEDKPFEFMFEESSLRTAAFKNCLNVVPKFGRIEAKGRRELKLRLTAMDETEINFNCKCKISGMKLPLFLNVKAEGYAMSALVFTEDLTGNKIELVPNSCCNLSFGDVEVNEICTRNVIIVNAAKFNSDFSFEQSKNKKAFVISPIKGSIECGQRQMCRITFQPTKQGDFRSELVLRIQHGPVFKLNLIGVASLPGLSLSFGHFNFGYVPIQKTGYDCSRCQLELKNSDSKDISIECLYESNSVLQHDFKACVLPAKGKCLINFSFSPIEPTRYEEQITFHVNGLTKTVCNIIGIGCSLKVEVLNPNDRRLRIGSKNLRVGGQITKIVPIINRTPVDVDVQLIFNPSSKILQNTGALSILPKERFHMKKNGKAEIHIVFNPKCRVPNFTEEVSIEFEKVQQPLLAVLGVCHGIEVSLDNDSLPFGAVTKDSWSSRKLLLMNDGDVGTKFEWDPKRFEPDFSITPIKGDIFPGMKVPFDVIFKPVKVNSDIRYEKLKCHIEGASPLSLTLTGTCIPVQPTRDTINIVTSVRKMESKSISIKNTSNMVWNLRPAVDGEFFSGTETLDIEAQSTRHYEINYLPLVMTSDKKHTGSIFFPIPDGSGLLYNLIGTAEAPRLNDRLNIEVPCKMHHVLKVEVKNWLKRPQRFKRRFDFIRPDKPDAGTVIDGLEYIDVPGDSAANYQVKFYAHREGIVSIKLTFTNEHTNEYQFFELNYKTVKPDVISTIELITPVRELVEHSVKLNNPLDHPVTFQVSTSSLPIDLLHMPSQQTVAAKSELDFTIEYRPFIVGEHKGRLEFNTNELGLYSYDVLLKATTAGPQPAVYFKTHLGLNVSQTVRFYHYAKVKADYHCKIDNAEFHVDKIVGAAPGSITGTEVSMEVGYEPASIGDVRSNLYISNSLGGDYVVPLFGTCLTSKPQGPFTIKAGSTTSINFRNVFSSTTPFSFQVDHQKFHVSKNSENIKAHKDYKIVVGFDGNDSKNAVMAKLVVSCAKSAGGHTNAQWVFYLKGVTN